MATKVAPLYKQLQLIIINYLDSRVIYPWTKTPTIIKYLRDQGVEASAATVRKSLKDLKAHGAIRRNSVGDWLSLDAVNAYDAREAKCKVQIPLNKITAAEIEDATGIEISLNNVLGDIKYIDHEHVARLFELVKKGLEAEKNEAEQEN